MSKKTESEETVVDLGPSVPLLGLYRDKENEYHVVKANFYPNSGKCEFVSATPTGGTDGALAEERFQIMVIEEGVFN